MKALLSKKFTENFDMKKLSREIEELFGTYNFMCELIGKHIVEETNDFFPIRGQRDTRSPELKELIKLEKYQKYVSCFSKRLENLKETFTEDEMIIFTYCIEQSELDKEVCARLCKTYKTYYQIKKSCYVKIALCFHLAEEEICSTLEKNFLVEYR